MILFRLLCMVLVVEYAAGWLVALGIYQQIYRRRARNALSDES